MIEIDRHIEILLLSNDCVIVPDLGGFMTHHVEAHYDQADGLFLPPQRTLGFNPQLTMNDSLLAQSYIEAYDLSYPEAIRRIEAEVGELRQHLDNEGYYELNDLGVLSVNDEGRLEFEPCEAGILTPALYGLYSFDMEPLKHSKGRKAAKRPQAALAGPTATASEQHLPSASDEKHAAVITIPTSWIRNAVAVAAALLAFLLMTTPIANSEDGQVSVSQVTLPTLSTHSNTKNTATSLDDKAVKTALQQQEADADAETKEATEATDATANTEDQADSEKDNATPATASTTDQQQQGRQQDGHHRGQKSYCIVMASQVSQAGAELYVKKLQAAGLTDARVYLYNNIRRVVCGAYATQAEAYRQLHEIHQHPDMAEAWVYEMKL